MLFMALAKFMEYFGIQFLCGVGATLLYQKYQKGREHHLTAQVKYRVREDILDETPTEELIEELSTRNDIVNKR